MGLGPGLYGLGLNADMGFGVSVPYSKYLIFVFSCNFCCFKFRLFTSFFLGAFYIV